MNPEQAKILGDKVGTILATLLCVAATWVFINAYQHFVTVTGSTLAGYAGGYIMVWIAAKVLRGILQPLQSI